MSKKKLTPEQEKAIKDDTPDLDNTLNENVGLDTTETFITDNLVQVNATDKDRENGYTMKNGLYRTKMVYNEQEQEYDREYDFYGNILIHNLTVIYDKLGLFPELVSLKYTNTAINQTSEINRKPFSVVASEIAKKLLLDTNSLGIESTLRKMFIHGCNKDLNGVVSITAETDLLKDGFFYDETTGKVIANNVFSNLKTSADDIRKAIRLFNNLIKNRGYAIPNDCTLFRFMLWSPFSYCLKQIGYTDDLYSMVLWGVTDTNKTGSSIMFSYLYADKDMTLQKANTQSAMGTRLGENTFPLILDENKDILSDPRNEEFLKNIVTDKIGRSVKDRADNNNMNDFPSLRQSVSTLNHDIPYKPEFLKRYKVLYYDLNMQVSESAKTEFNKKYKPKSPNTPLKQLRHLGKVFSEYFIPYIESQSDELYDLESLTIKILKEIANKYGEEFNMNVYIKQDSSKQDMDTGSVIRNGLNKLFRKVHRLQTGQSEPMDIDFQRCAKASEISWLDYKPANNEYYIKVTEFEKEISEIAGGHTPIEQALKELDIPTGEIKERKFKSSKVKTAVVSEYNLTYKMFNINIYDNDELLELQELETFLRLYQDGYSDKEIMNMMGIKLHTLSILIDENVTDSMKEKRKITMELRKKGDNNSVND